VRIGRSDALGYGRVMGPAGGCYFRPAPMSLKLRDSGVEDSPYSRPEVFRGGPRRGHWTPVENSTHPLVWANLTRIGTMGPNRQRGVMGSVLMA